MSASVERRLQLLEKRLQQVESELAIRNVMTRYGLAVDCGDIPAALSCHSEDAIYTVSAPKAGRDDGEPVEDLKLVGHQAIRDMLASDMHQSLLPNCAHTVGPVCVEVAEGVARSTGYSRLYRRENEDFKLMRLAINEWHFKRQAGNWLIVSRESRLLGEDEAQQLLKHSAFSLGEYVSSSLQI